MKVEEAIEGSCKKQEKALQEALQVRAVVAMAARLPLDSPGIPGRRLRGRSVGEPLQRLLSRSAPGLPSCSQN